MKRKLLILFLLIGLFFIIGCHKLEEGNKDNQLEISNDINVFIVNKINDNSIYRVDKENNLEEFNTFLINLQKIKYQEKQKINNNSQIIFEYDYIVSLSDEIILKVFDQSFIISNIDNEVEGAYIDYSLNTVTIGSFDFLNNLNYKPIVTYEEILLNYSLIDLSEMSLSIVDNDISLDLSNNDYLKNILLNLKLYRNYVNDDIESRNSKYVLSFSSYEITIYDDGTICYIDEENELDYLYTMNNEFSYLDSLVDGDFLDFSKYNEEIIIRVSNSLKDTVEVENKESFLNSLKQIKYLKLNYKEHYQLGDLKYQISLGDDVIDIYNECMVINDDLYIIVEGGFSFLNNIKFSSSSGWLPWI